MLKVSFIGFRRHAELLRNIFNQKKNIKIYKIFSKTKINNSKYIFCNSISELMDSDVIVIASPTDFHYEHIFKLTNFKGYIFCEKPIVGSKLEINKLKKNNKLNISNFYTNFNFRFNKLNDLIKKIHLNKKFGKVIKINIHISHASALKKSWRKEWRLNTKSKLGPLETTGIHYIDMVRNLFGNIQLIDSYHFSQLELNEIDSSDVFFKSSEILFNFRFSYCESPRIYFFIIFKNGYAEYDGLKFNIFYPKKNFDKNNFSRKSKLYYTENINFTKEWKKSINQSIDYFIERVKLKKKFRNFKSDLSTLIDFF